MIVAEYDDENIIEEYITNYNQIIYEQYAFQIETTSVIIVLSMCLTESP